MHRNSWINSSRQVFHINLQIVALDHSVAARAELPIASSSEDPRV
jgi:hypothetical protein